MSSSIATSSVDQGYSWQLPCSKQHSDEMCMQGTGISGSTTATASVLHSSSREVVKGYLSQIICLLQLQLPLWILLHSQSSNIRGVFSNQTSTNGRFPNPAPSGNALRHVQVYYVS